MGSSGTGAYESLLEVGVEHSVAHQLDDLITEGYFPPEGYPSEVGAFFVGIDQVTLQKIIGQYKSSDFSETVDFGSLLLKVAREFWDKKPEVAATAAPSAPMHDVPARTDGIDQQPPQSNSQAYQDAHSFGGASDNFRGSFSRSSGPNSDRLQRILDRTGYKYEATSGQRSYGPGPGYEDFKPPRNCQCYFGKIPYEYQVEDLIELFEKSGTIYHMRLMMNPETGKNQTYGFVTFTDPQIAQNCVQMYDNYECQIPGKVSFSLCIILISDTEM